MKKTVVVGAWLAAALVWAVPVSAIPTHSEMVPPWAYQSISRLAQAGYVTLPEKIWTLDRMEFAHVLAEALTNLQDGQRLTSAETVAVDRTDADGEVETADSDRISGSGEAFSLATVPTEKDTKQGELLQAEFLHELAAIGYTAAQKPVGINMAQTGAPRPRASALPDSRPAADSPAGESAGRGGNRQDLSEDEIAQEMARSTFPPGKGNTPRFKLDGAVRADYGRHTGPQSIGERSRLRVRLYSDYNIDDNWHLLGMVEWEETLHGLKGSNNGRISLDRYYLEGYSGITLLDIGAFGSRQGEGNIYDSKFTGVRATVGDPVTYTLEAGTTKASHRVYNGRVSYRTVDQELWESGFYYFDPLYKSTRRRILMMNYRRPIGDFDLGLMYLRGWGDGAMKDGNGFVGTLSIGKEDSWRQGAQMGYLKYYHQPKSTYAAHTMNGMADYMDGFQGWGVGYTYTLRRDWLLSVELDRLQDLRTGAHNNTLWVALTYYFKLY